MWYDMGMVMAWATCPYYSVTHALAPFLRRQATFIRPNFSHIHSFSPTGYSTLSSSRHEYPKVFAQARRSVPSMSKEAVASAVDLQFESPLSIVQYPDPVLRVKNKRVNTFDESMKTLVDEMFEVMYKTDGIGLSAPQVGINVQLMVFNPAGERGEGEEFVLVNPRISRYSQKMVPFDEGCLSFPGIYGDVQRPASLTVDAKDITGARFEINLTGLPARVFQHEYDHLQGILFIERMSDQVLDSIRAKLQDLEKNYEGRTGLPSPERIDTRRRKKAAGFGRS